MKFSKYLLNSIHMFSAVLAVGGIPRGAQPPCLSLKTSHLIEKRRYTPAIQDDYGNGVHLNTVRLFTQHICRALSDTAGISQQLREETWRL